MTINDAYDMIREHLNENYFSYDWNIETRNIAVAFIAYSSAVLGDDVKILSDDAGHLKFNSDILNAQKSKDEVALLVELAWILWQDPAPTTFSEVRFGSEKIFQWLYEKKVSSIFACMSGMNAEIIMTAFKIYLQDVLPPKLLNCEEIDEFIEELQFFVNANIKKENKKKKNQIKKNVNSNNDDSVREREIGKSPRRSVEREK